MPAVAGSWTSPSDDGFRAARADASPATGCVDHGGAPKRVPSANLVPGKVGTNSQPAPHPAAAGRPGGPDGGGGPAGGG